MDTLTSPELEAIKSLKQIAREEFILPGTAICGGCGGLEALRLTAKVFGPKTCFVNAAGCFTRLATFPYSPFKGSWLYTTRASAASCTRTPAAAWRRASARSSKDRSGVAHERTFATCV
jgi:pyruvate/2-oxoacid:ferredoxin oxidoreductase beta subunit